MIPRTEIFVISGDVTIEELRGEADEEPLTAETLAERIGGGPLRRATKSSEPLNRARRHCRGGGRLRGPPHRSTLAVVLLAVDVGKYADGLRPLRGRDPRRSAFSHRDRKRRRNGRRARCAPGPTFLDFDSLDGICLSSTVPRLIREYEHVAERWAKAPLLVDRAGRQDRDPDPVLTTRAEVGARPRDERRRREGEIRRAGDRPSTFGTSTNFDVVSADGD